MLNVALANLARYGHAQLVCVLQKHKERTKRIPNEREVFTSLSRRHTKFISRFDITFALRNIQFYNLSRFFCTEGVFFVVLE